jgi:large subunit ribosomal protein L3
MKGLIGKKAGMTSVFIDGKHMGVTVIDVTGNQVTQLKTEENDGYTAVQLAYDDKREKSVVAAEAGHFKRAGVAPKSKLVEFRDFDFEKKEGETVGTEIFAEGEKISVIGISKGKGFQGVVKRHGFSGVGMATHGQHDRQRAPGSIGASSDPSRVLKGMRMAGRMGGDRIKTLNVKIVKILAEENLVLVNGSVPGAIGSYIVLEGR